MTRLRIAALPEGWHPEKRGDDLPPGASGTGFRREERAPQSGKGPGVADDLQSAEVPVSFLLGLPLHRVTMSETLAWCLEILGSRRQSTAVTANLDFALRASEDPGLRHFIFGAGRVLCDGMPMVWLSRLLDVPLPERVAGSDLVPQLLQCCAQHGFGVFFLGSSEAVMARAARVSRERCPGLRITGSWSPPHGPIESWPNAEIVRAIRDSGTDLLVVALGCPKQERWLEAFLPATGASLGIGVGASLDFLAGTQIRAPRFLHPVGLEWLWRMCKDPRRLSKRYLLDFLFLLRSCGTHLRFHREFSPAAGRPGAGWRRPEEPECPADDETGGLDLAHWGVVTPARLSLLASWARKAASGGEKVRVLHATDSVRNAIREFALDRYFNLDARDFTLPRPSPAPEPSTRILRLPHTDLCRRIWPEIAAGIALLKDESELEINVESARYADAFVLLRLCEERAARSARNDRIRLAGVRPELRRVLRSAGCESLAADSNRPLTVLLSAGMIQGGKSGVGRYVIEIAHALSQRRGVHLIIAGLEADRHLFPAQRVSWITIPAAWAAGFPNLLWHQWALPRLIRRVGVDVVHIPSYRRLVACSPAPQVATIHDCAPFRLRNRYDPLRGLLGRIVAPALARRCDRIVAVSEFTAADLQHFMKLPAERISVIPEGFNPDAFFPRPQSEIREFLAAHNQSAPYFLCVARLEHPAKNHLRLIEAYEKFRRDSGAAETAHLILAGSDWHGAGAIHARIFSSPYSADIRRLGFVADESLPWWYCGAEGVVLPSLSEGFGLPLLEAQACGIPVAASRRDSLPEVAGPAAILFDPEDCASIAAALSALRNLSQKERSLRFDLGRRWVDRFSWESCADRLVDLYTLAHVQRS
ncbi:MAG TPA: WecB/TagA/CpsF family glycosyltransferase [Verrucomicrobiales bacterium]|nr:WecB/TagA/CpsF family glycosyltransferase [Verrucomicrobiales bacterium]